MDSKFMFMRPVIRALARGPAFRTIFFALLLVQGIAAGVVGLGAFAFGLKLLENLQGAAMAGGLICDIIVLAGFLTAAQVYLVRAWDIGELPDSEFPVNPIIALLVRLLGELYAVAIATLSLCSGIMVLVTDHQFARRLMREIPGMSGPADLLGLTSLQAEGDIVVFFAVILGGASMALLAIVLSYMAAEWISVAFSFARDVSDVRRRLVPPESSPQPARVRARLPVALTAVIGIVVLVFLVTWAVALLGGKSGASDSSGLGSLLGQSNLESSKLSHELPKDEDIRDRFYRTEASERQIQELLRKLSNAKSESEQICVISNVPC